MINSNQIHLTAYIIMIMESRAKFIFITRSCIWTLTCKSQGSYLQKSEGIFFICYMICVFSISLHFISHSFLYRFTWFKHIKTALNHSLLKMRWRETHTGGVVYNFGCVILFGPIIFVEHLGKHWLFKISVLTQLILVMSLRLY